MELKREREGERNEWLSSWYIKNIRTTNANVCLFVPILLFEKKRKKKPKDIPLFAYINKTANNSSGTWIEKGKKRSRIGNELNRILSREGAQSTKKKPEKKDIAEIVDTVDSLWYCLYSAYAYIECKLIELNWTVQFRARSRSLYYLVE